MRAWRNWQTRKIQVLVAERSWRFNSSRPHFDFFSLTQAVFSCLPTCGSVAGLSYRDIGQQLSVSHVTAVKYVSQAIADCNERRNQSTARYREEHRVESVIVPRHYPPNVTLTISLGWPTSSSAMTPRARYSRTSAVPATASAAWSSYGEFESKDSFRQIVCPAKRT